jgi:hypothetical protein
VPYNGMDAASTLERKKKLFLQLINQLRGGKDLENRYKLECPFSFHKAFVCTHRRSNDVINT